MAWPTPQEYNEAIQNPPTAFTDPELRSGQPVLTPLGLPRPITGNFASVYQMVCTNQRVWAVRCFLRDFDDHQERYAAISQHLAQFNLPYMVNFTFLADGIRVGGNRYPILKMEWVEGEPFLAYIERNLNAPVILLDIARQWVQMAQTLAQAGIAHGDLQHGNLIVVQGRLKLIDYDGMYVPALAGRRSHEVGHRNYQHPQRSEATFGPEIDHFSSWIIYTSLVALTAEPSLWQRLRGGDECLLFRREDFVAPERSPTLATLEQMGDARLTRLAATLRTLLTLAPEEIPPVYAQFDLNAIRAQSPVSWLRDHLGGAQKAPSTASHIAAQVAPTQQGDASWLEDFIGAPDAVASSASYRRERTAAAASAALLTAAWLLIDLGALGLAAPALTIAAVIAGNLGYLGYCYRLQAEVVARRVLHRQLRMLRRSRRVLEQEIAVIKRNEEHIQRVHNQQISRIERALASAQQTEQRTLAAENERHRRRIEKLQVRRHRQQQEETLKVQQIETQFKERITDIDRRLAAIGQAETNARRKLLEERRRRFVAEFLQRQKIEKALISGIGPTVKERLKEHGIVRVTDVTAEQLAGVPGVGAARADLLLTWRQRVESLAWQGAPTRLDRNDERAIHRHHARLHDQLHKERDRLERKLAKQLATVRDKAARQTTRLAEEEAKLEDRHRRQVAEIRKRQRERTTVLLAERNEIDRQAKTFLNELEQMRSGLARRQQQLDAEQSALDALLAQRKTLHFRTYLRRVFLLR